jgi:monoamine oxidase
MSRTPLFRYLRRSYDLARVSLRTGEPPAAVLERYRAARISRRRFLGTSGAAVAGLAIGCRPRREAAPEKAGPREVVVIGAGIAGLTAAYRLHQHKVPVRVFEGQKRVGGRMWSLRDHFPEGLVCELGGELVDSNHEAIQKMCGELELTLDDFEQDDKALARDVWFFEGKRIKDEAVVEAFRPIAAKIDEAGAEGWFRTLLDVGYTTEYGREIAEQSAWNLLMMIDTNPDPFRIFGESDERFHIRGGNDQVPTRLAERLGDRVETDTRLEALAQRADGAYELALRRGETSRTVVADRVLLALPFTKLREVRLDLDLPPVKRKAIDEIGYGTNAKLMVGFSERLWRAQGSNGSVLTDLPFQLTWESTRLQPGKAGILVCFTGGQRGLEIGGGTPAEQSERFARELERVFPGAAERRIGEARFHWPTFEWMKASYACYLPGQWTTICGAEGERVGNLHFAGEHTSLDFQGFMEGGCESGERAAREVLVDLGLAEPEAEEPEEKVAAAGQA